MTKKHILIRRDSGDIFLLWALVSEGKIGIMFPNSILLTNFIGGVNQLLGTPISERGYEGLYKCTYPNGKILSYMVPYGTTRCKEDFDVIIIPHFDLFSKLKIERFVYPQQANVFVYGVWKGYEKHLMFRAIPDLVEIDQTGPVDDLNGFVTVGVRLEGVD